MAANAQTMASGASGSSIENQDSRVFLPSLLTSRPPASSVAQSPKGATQPVAKLQLGSLPKPNSGGNGGRHDDVECSRRTDMASKKAAKLFTDLILARVIQHADVAHPQTSCDSARNFSDEQLELESRLAREAPRPWHMRPSSTPANAMRLLKPRASHVSETCMLANDEPQECEGFPSRSNTLDACHAVPSRPSSVPPSSRYRRPRARQALRQSSKRQRQASSSGRASPVRCGDSCDATAERSQSPSEDVQPDAMPAKIFSGTEAVQRTLNEAGVCANVPKPEPWFRRPSFAPTCIMLPHISPRLSGLVEEQLCSNETGGDAPAASPSLKPSCALSRMLRRPASPFAALRSSSPYDAPRPPSPPLSWRSQHWPSELVEGTTSTRTVDSDKEARGCSDACRGLGHRFPHFLRTTTSASIRARFKSVVDTAPCRSKHSAMPATQAVASHPHRSDTHMSGVVASEQLHFAQQPFEASTQCFHADDKSISGKSHVPPVQRNVSEPDLVCHSATGSLRIPRQGGRMSLEQPVAPAPDTQINFRRWLMATPQSIFENMADPETKSNGLSTTQSNAPEQPSGSFRRAKAYAAFCSESKGGMSFRGFSKFCKYTGIAEQIATITDLNLIFDRVTPTDKLGKRLVSWHQFEEAVALLADWQGISLEILWSRIEKAGAPHRKRKDRARSVPVKAEAVAVGSPSLPPLCSLIRSPSHTPPLTSQRSTVLVSSFANQVSSWDNQISSAEGSSSTSPEGIETLQEQISEVTPQHVSSDELPQDIALEIGMEMQPTLRNDCMDIPATYFAACPPEKGWPFKVDASMVVDWQREEVNIRDALDAALIFGAAAMKRGASEEQKSRDKVKASHAVAMATLAEAREAAIVIDARGIEKAAKGAQDALDFFFLTQRCFDITSEKLDDMRVHVEDAIQVGLLVMQRDRDMSGEEPALHTQDSTMQALEEVFCTTSKVLREHLVGQCADEARRQAREAVAKAVTCEVGCSGVDVSPESLHRALWRAHVALDAVLLANPDACAYGAFASIKRQAVNALQLALLDVTGTSV